MTGRAGTMATPARSGRALAAVAGQLERGVGRRYPKRRREMSTLKDLLRNAREAKCWSLQEAADMLGTTKGHLHDLEAGRSDNPTLRLVAALVIVYGLRPEAVVASAIQSPTSTA